MKESVGQLSKLTPDDCPFLRRKEDGKTMCSIYENRLGSCSNLNVCIRIEDALRFGDLPPDCPYAMAMPGYTTKVVDWMSK